MSERLAPSTFRKSLGAPVFQVDSAGSAGRMIQVLDPPVKVGLAIDEAIAHSGWFF
jgi:hypothetical protein